MNTSLTLFLCLLALSGFLLAEDFNLPSGKISSSRLLKTFNELSPYFNLKTRFKINRYTRSYAALWHFTTGANCCGVGSRLPGIFLFGAPTNYLQVSYAVNNYGDARRGFYFRTNQWYTLELSQTKEGNNDARLKLVVDGRTRWTVLNRNVKPFRNVKLYQGSPTRYTEGVRNPSTPDVDYEYFHFENGADPDCMCGLQNKAREIFGGTETIPHEFPWNVVLYRNGRFSCGGSLISKQHVLTAAHCAEYSKNEMRIHMGAHDRDDPEFISTVSNIALNPKWKKGSGFGSNAYVASDTAVITLTRPVEFTYTVRPVCFPANPSQSFANQNALATGWGRTESGTAAEKLMKVGVKVLSTGTCKNSYASITETLHICTTGGLASNHGTRAGDSGSPLNLRENERYAVIGVNSFASNPDVFSRITPDVYNWIKSIASGTDTSKC